jgi:hypothetical protein
MPLTKEELIKLKHQIDANDYRLVEHGNARILVIRSALEFPDIVNDLEIMINRFDIRDTNQLSSACIIGDAEVVGVGIDAIESLMKRRIEDDEIIAAHLAEKLDDPYSTLLFDSDDDPLKVLRLGIRVPGKLEEFKPQELQENLFLKIKNVPHNGEIIYLITEDGYVRISGKDFYSQLKEFLHEHPEINQELATELVDTARDDIAEYFLSKESEDIDIEPGRQEQLNAFIQGPTEEIEKENIKGDKEIEKQIEKPKAGKQTTKEILKKDEPIDNFLEDSAASNEETIDKELPDTELEISIDSHERFKKIESQSDKDYLKSWPSQEIFLDEFKEKLVSSGYLIVSGIEIPGVDVVADKPHSLIRKVFFCYMPNFEFKKAMAFERSLTRFSSELGIIIGSKMDTDLKLFIVGKNVLLTDYDTILNSEYLRHIEDQI